ncbi:MAG: hypothetical protein Q4F33_03565 [Mycoplasmatota bacterium]|nr:hypothetical protein [Mycoplasmatota bacterium]
MIRMRIQVEEMHVYYFIAKRLINNAKLGFMGIMASSEERLLNNIYNSWDLDEIADLSKKLFDRLDKEQIEAKINTASQSFKDIEELISEAISYTANLLFKPEVLDNVRKTLKTDLNVHDKIVLCVDKIAQVKRLLMELSPEERKNVLDGKGLEIKKQKQVKGDVVKAVDAENVENVTEVEIKSITDSEVVRIEENEETVIESGASENNVSEARKVFTAADVPEVDFEQLSGGILPSDEPSEEVEVLDVDESISYGVEILDDEENISKEMIAEVEELLDEEEIEDENVTVDSDFCESIPREVIIVVPERYNKKAAERVNLVEDTTLESKSNNAIREPEVIYPETEINNQVEESTYFELPTIVKIIERDGNVVDENVIE